MTVVYIGSDSLLKYCKVYEVDYTVTGINNFKENIENKEYILKGVSGKHSSRLFMDIHEYRNSQIDKII